MKLSQIASRILVDNFEESFIFYTEVLGYKVDWGSIKGPFASFKTETCDQVCLSIFQRKNMKLYKGFTLDESKKKDDALVLIIPTDDLEKDYQMLRKKGVTFLGKPQTIEEWYMKCVYFRDNEGNLIELSQELS